MVNSIKHITIFFLITSSLLHTLLSTDCFSQNINSERSRVYLPQYNLWSFDPAHDGLPGSSSRVGIPNPPFITDSIFTWQYVQTETYNFTTDIFFIDSLYGWATHSGLPGGVFRTTNSGFNWDSTVLIPGGSCRGVHFINRDTGWVVGLRSIRKTTNGGLNWVKQDTFYYGIYYNYFNSVHFFNPDTGIIIGERARGYPDTSWGGCVLKTTNGGENWTQVYSTNDTIYSSTELRRQFWLNNDTGWFAGNNILLKTTDGGTSFTNYYSKVPPTQNGYNGFIDLYFINEDTGWICGSNWDHKNIYETTNAGLNWTFQDNPIAYYQFPQINGIIFINSDTGWASSFYGFIIVTTNGGNNWVIDYLSIYEANKFTKFNDTKIWCTGDNGRFLYTLLNKPIGINGNQQILPDNFKLYPNYPNPFNSATKIRFDLNKKFIVSIKIFNIQGQEIEIITNKEYNHGNYEIIWEANNYPSGIYFCRCEVRDVTRHTEGFIKTIKLVLLK